MECELCLVINMQLLKFWRMISIAAVRVEKTCKIGYVCQTPSVRWRPRHGDLKRQVTKCWSAQRLKQPRKSIRKGRNCPLHQCSLCTYHPQWMVAWLSGNGIGDINESKREQLTCPNDSDPVSLAETIEIKLQDKRKWVADVEPDVIMWSVRHRVRVV